MRRSLALFMFAVTMACASRDASGVGLQWLRAEYKARFLAHDGSLYVEVDNVPGINLVEVQARKREDKVCLVGTFISSGGPGRRLIQLDLTSMHLSPGWEQKVYWAEPDGTLSRVEVERIDQPPR